MFLKNRNTTKKLVNTVVCTSNYVCNYGRVTFIEPRLVNFDMSFCYLSSKVVNKNLKKKSFERMYFKYVLYIIYVTMK